MKISMNQLKLSAGIIAVLLAVVLFTGFDKPREKSTNQFSVDTIQAKIGATDENVMSPGSIVPANTVQVSIPPAPPNETFSGVVRDVFVNVGDHVSKGQLLAVMDATEENTVTSELSAKTLEAERQYDLVKTLYRPEQIEVQRLQVITDEKNTNEAKAHLQLLLDGNRPELINLAKAGLDEQKTILEQLKNDNVRAHALFEKDLISKSALEQNDEAVAAQEDKVVEAAAQLKIDELGSRPEDIAAARDSVEMYASTRDKDKETLKVMLLGSRPEAIEAAKQAVEAAKAAENLQHQVVTHQYIKAPRSGVIIERNVNPGEAAGPALIARSDSMQPLANNTEGLFEIADDSSVEFMANVDQLFYQSVYPGQEATLTIEALPGRTFKAKILRIQPLVSSLERNTPGESNPSTPLTFTVWAEVNNVGHQLVPGQTGIIAASKKTSGLVVPQSAVSAFTLGQGGVYVVKDGVAHLRSVRYEGNSDGYVHVLSGLNDGEEVVVSDSTQLRDGSHVIARTAPASDFSPRAAGL